MAERGLTQSTRTIALIAVSSIIPIPTGMAGAAEHRQSFPPSHTRLAPAPAIHTSSFRQNALFGDAPTREPEQTTERVLEVKPPPDQTLLSGLRWRGYFLQQSAVRTSSPQNLTRLRPILQIGFDRELNEAAKLRFMGRFFYDGVFDLTRQYPGTVRKDEEQETVFREAYLELNRGNWALTMGNQQIVWGEVQGLFVADVVTAKDFRDFLLMDFEFIRIPRAAANLQYFGERNNLQLIWIPLLEFDNLDEPGAEFSVRPPVPAGTTFQVVDSGRPSRSLRNSEVGLRWSGLFGGWNPALFYFYAFEHTPAFIPQIDPTGLQFRTQYARIHQFGYSVSKELAGVVFKSEGVLSLGRSFALVETVPSNRAIRRDVVETAFGASYTFPHAIGTHLQLYYRDVINRDPLMFDRMPGTAASLWLNPKVLGQNLSPEMFIIYDVAHGDWMFRPRLSWNVTGSWALTVGLDLFGGDDDGFFGQFRNKDRAYTFIRFNF